MYYPDSLYARVRLAAQERQSVVEQAKAAVLEQLISVRSAEPIGELWEVQLTVATIGVTIQIKDGTVTNIDYVMPLE